MRKKRSVARFVTHLVARVQSTRVDRAQRTTCAHIPSMQMHSKFEVHQQARGTRSDAQTTLNRYR